MGLEEVQMRTEREEASPIQDREEANPCRRGGCCVLCGSRSGGSNHGRAFQTARCEPLVGRCPRPWARTLDPNMTAAPQLTPPVLAAAAAAPAAPRAPSPAAPAPHCATPPASASRGCGSWSLAACPSPGRGEGREWSRRRAKGRARSEPPRRCESRPSSAW